jgi:hypothetical protein
MKIGSYKLNTMPNVTRFWKKLSLRWREELQPKRSLYWPMSVGNKVGYYVGQEVDQAAVEEKLNLSDLFELISDGSFTREECI